VTSSWFFIRQLMDGDTKPVQREEAWNVVHSDAGRHERFDTNLNFTKLTSSTNNGSATCI